MRTLVRTIILFSIWLGFAAAPVAAQSIESLYRGKTVKLVLAAAPGGGADLYARIFIKHFGRHVPGNPTFVIQNVPGAGGSPVVTDSPTRGVLHVDVSTKARAGVWTLAVAEGTQVIMSHIHLGSASANGAPVLALAPQFPAGQDHTLTSLAQLPTFNPPVNVSLSVWKGAFTAADFINLGAPPPTWDEFVVALKGGNLYGNVHTVALPNGAIRGQLAPAL